MKRWRGGGIRAIVYIDDGIVPSSSKERNALDRDVVITDLRRAGFVTNTLESKLDPNNLLTGWDLYMNVPEDKVEKRKSRLESQVRHWRV